MRFPERPGAVYRRVALRGCAEVVVYPLIFGGGRLGLGPTGDQYDGGLDRVWDYESLDDALHAAHEWDGTGEPAGFYREAGKPPVRDLKPGDLALRPTWRHFQ